MPKLTSTIFCTLLILCCTSVKVAHFNGVERSPTDHIDVYSSFGSIQKKYKEIGLITAKGDKAEVDLIEYLKEKAMEIGANAIVLIGSEKNTEYGYVIGYMFWAGGDRISKVVAIVYLDK